MKTLYLVIFLFGFKAVYAHNPDLSSLMIYEQNGKSILVIKSSLTAFEGEVDYIYKKDAYKTPEEFNQLVIKNLQKNCFVIANGDTIHFTNIQVQLGHETTLFAELTNVPKQIKTFSVRCALFKDFSNNMCELILTGIRSLPLKQYILNNNNQHQVAFKIEEEKWVVDEPAGSSMISTTLFLGLAVFSIVAVIAFIEIKRKRQFAI